MAGRVFPSSLSRLDVIRRAGTLGSMNLPVPGRCCLCVAGHDSPVAFSVSLLKSPVGLERYGARNFPSCWVTTPDMGLVNPLR
jgi:hypothetical protein